MIAQGRGTYTVHIIVAIDSYLLPFLQSSHYASHRLVEIWQMVRRVKIFQLGKKKITSLRGRGEVADGEIQGTQGGDP